MTDYSKMSDDELMRAEREIVQNFLGRVPWEMVIWGFGNALIWLSLWPLVLFNIIPLWVGFLIACVNMVFSYLPSHEAQHDIIARPGEKLRWLNQMVGHITLIPLASSHHALYLTHMEHHKHTNDPARDPDYGVTARNGLHHIWVGIKGRQPSGQGSLNRYGDVLQEMGTPQAKQALTHSILWVLFYYGFLCAMAMSGYALEAFLLWWLPRNIGLSYIQYFLSWAPHHPGKKSGRYRDTRAFKHILGHIGTMGMTVHIIHHLHPRIPLTQNVSAYRALRPILEARGCELGGLKG